MAHLSARSFPALLPDQCRETAAMARPIWTGTLSFGLLNIPVSLLPGERKTDLHFRMLDSRDKKPVHYERVNADTGEEVPWKDIVKAFEYDKGSYVVLEEDEMKAAAPEKHETVEVEAFVDAGSIASQFYEKPYVLVPARKAEKGYVLLRETLKSTKQIGIARVVIRTREYLAAVMPQDDALILQLLRYAQEIVDPADYKLPAGKTTSYRITPKEMEMAKQLVSSMSGEWKPDEYHDEFRARLEAVIQNKMKASKASSKADDDVEPQIAADAATNVVDFMALLKKSIAGNKRTPAKKVSAKKTPVRKSATKKSEKKTASGKATAKSSNKGAGKSTSKASGRKAG
jgi:DNA end-binding protein Ku